MTANNLTKRKPGNTVERVHDLYAVLRQQGQVGKRIPNPVWNAIICKQWRVSIEMAHRVTQTGAAMGLWRRGQSTPFRSSAYVEVLPHEVVTIPEPVPASVDATEPADESVPDADF